MYEYVFSWGNNEKRAERKGKRCRIVARGSRLHSVLVEFEDGERLVTSDRALRSAPLIDRDPGDEGDAT